NGGNPVRAFGERPDGGGNDGGSNPEPGIYNLTFDLYLFDSWDGLDRTYGEDRFRVAVNDETLFDQPLETFEPWENELAGWTRPDENIYAGWAQDLIYRDISIDFTFDGSGPLVIDFISEQNQILVDESWGIDNVRITQSSVRTQAVPAAPTAALMLGGIGALARRRR
ncbi:MAG: hypothetical protein AAGA55_10695, partial [Planctomycetota bacterium]